MEGQPMFLNCPAYVGNDGAAPCGLPAEVEVRYTVRSTDGPLEGAKIRCPRGHWFNGPIEFLTVKSGEEHAPGTAGRALGAGPDSCRHQSASPFGGTPNPPKRGSTASRPNGAPAYYLGRPASLWISVISPRRKRNPPKHRANAITGGRGRTLSQPTGPFPGAASQTVRVTPISA
jgi:hypothetical protein